jgi:hypothetical protein
MTVESDRRVWGYIEFDLTTLDVDPRFFDESTGFFGLYQLSVTMPVPQTNPGEELPGGEPVAVWVRGWCQDPDGGPIQALVASEPHVSVAAPPGVEP